MEVTIHMYPTLFSTPLKLTLKLFIRIHQDKTNVISAINIDLHFQDTSKQNSGFISNQSSLGGGS